MKKLLLAVSLLGLAVACKTNQQNTRQPATDSVWEAPQPGVDAPQKYDSLKNELNNRRKNKQ